MSKIVTIVGQGYVGLPLAEGASEAGWKVWGLDTSEVKVNALNAGRSHIDDLSDSDISKMLDQGYRATLDPVCIEESDLIVVCVPTPLGEGGSPDLGSVEASTRTIAAHIKPGATYVLESTTYPGTTEHVCVPILEEISGMQAGVDFHVAYSPERVNPGMTEFGIRNTPKLVGGLTVKGTEKALDFYGSFVEDVVPVSGLKEAETAKLLENTFRHVNIALVNEMAKFCHELNIDIWEVIRGADTKPFGFMRFTPGPGVGGHCIPIDPNYLSYEVRKQLGYPFRFVELAQEINNSMPAYVVSRVAEKLNDIERSLRGSKILLLGVTYKADIADQRESPAIPVAEQFIRKGSVVDFHDPLVSSWNLPESGTIERVDDLERSIHDADVVVLLQPHRAYSTDEISATAKIFFDATGTSSDKDARL